MPVKHIQLTWERYLTLFDHTSLLKYLTDKWNLGVLGRRTAQANSVAVALRFLAKPRTDTIPFIRVPNSDLYAPHPELEEWDRSGHHDALHLFAEYLARKLDERSGISHMERSRFGSHKENLWTGVQRWFDVWMLRLGYHLSQVHQARERKIIDVAEGMKRQGGLS